MQSRKEDDHVRKVDKYKEVKKMRDKAVLRKNPNVVTRVILDETILLPVYKSSSEINCIYTLNKAASRVWEMVDGKKNITVIKKQVLEEFDTTPRESEKGLDKLLGELKKIKAVI